MENKFLKNPIKPIDLEKINKISELLTAFNSTSFQSRNLAKCTDVFVEMLKDEERPVIFLGIAGAMVPAGMHGIISTMIRNNMIDVIVSTGANMYHDLIEALGGHHYVGSPNADDVLLRENNIDRIYDTYADELKFKDLDKTLKNLVDELSKQKSSPISSRFFLNYLGEFIEQGKTEKSKKNSIIWNCWKNETPIFVPALNDSSIGLAVTQHYIKSKEKKEKPLIIDAIKDNYEILKIKKNAIKSGVIFIGGGVPKNYIQQMAYFQDVFDMKSSAHDYGFQVTTDNPHWGGLSGCTFKEAISWGKEKSSGKYATCHCDATIALPLIVKAVLERCENIKKRGRIHTEF